MSYVPKSIFPTLSLDRDKVRWEEHLETLTPWENRAGIWFKREDYFNVFGEGSPNGSKLRQLIWYFNRYRGNKTHVTTGASVQSPQLSMTSVVARHYGMDCTCVVYSKPKTILSHDNPRIAAGFGAKFDYALGPYNKILQTRVGVLERSAPTYEAMPLVVPYGISLPQDRFNGAAVRDFHEVGAHQVSNIPEEVTQLIVPAGSCNTLASVVLGLIADPHNVRELYTLGIGPSRQKWFSDRFDHMGVSLGDLPFRWKHLSLHDIGYSTYSEKFRGESWEGISFHPTYEAKIIRYLRQHRPMRRDGTVGFWIVGAEARPEVVAPFYTHGAAV